MAANAGETIGRDFVLIERGDWGGTVMAVALVAAALGLARAFLVAGTKTTVVSQWQVPGTRTIALFERFYSQVAATGTEQKDQKALSPVDALRKAQIEQVEMLPDRDAAQKRHRAFGVFVGCIRAGQ